MIEFKPLSFADKEKMEQLCYRECCPGPENCFNNMYIWRDYYKPEICYFGEQIILRFYAYERPAYSYPMGQGDLKNAVEQLKRMADELGESFVLMGHGEKQAEMLESVYPGAFNVKWDRDYSAYVHNIEKLAEYPGKALHSKKNLCNQFEKANDWRFIPVTAELIPLCMDFMEHWLMDNAERLDPDVSYELRSLSNAFEDFSALGLEGGALYSGDRMVGFSLGERCTENCFVCHFEKADGEIKGAYAMVCRELSRMVRDKYPGLTYINREEDMGIEALRRSKLSYKPDFMVPQFFAEWIYE